MKYTPIRPSHYCGVLMAKLWSPEIEGITLFVNAKITQKQTN